MSWATASRRPWWRAGRGTRSVNPAVKHRKDLRSVGQIGHSFLTSRVNHDALEEMMNECRITGSARLCAVFVLAAGSLVSAPDSRDTREVRCDRRDSLAEALSKADPGDTLRVFGTCKERVVVKTGNLTLDGLGAAVLDGGGAS